jgi:dipeptidyl aminopeptidase/acylaminoacyl peptidase
VAVPRAGEEAPAAQRVTDGPFEEGDPVWSPDGSRIFFTSTRVAEPYYTSEDRDLFSVPAAGGEARSEASIDGVIEEFAWSPDGRRLAFQAVPEGNPERSYDQPELFVTEARPGASARNLTAGYDYDVGAALTGDQKAPRGGQTSLLLWTPDGRWIVVRTAERGRANLARIDAASGRVEPLTRGDQEVVAYTASRDRSRLALVISTAVSVGDLFALAPAGGTPRRLTSFNDALFNELTLTPPVEITYLSFDGRPIHGWVQRPPDFVEGRKYPLILNVHGGPHAAFGHTFDHEFQWMAAKGYVVLYTNPRGSSTYGLEFGNLIQFRYPGDDHQDLMASVDELVRRGWADPEKLGITGGSGGGVLTNWAITQTDRFAAAVSQRSIADWSAFWYTADFTLFTPSWFRGAPWEDPQDYAARSPITHAAKIETPLMLIEGEADDRTPAGAGGEQLFRALKYLKKPVVMVRFPGENHDLSRTGKPWHRIERLQHLVGWFDKYLQGKDSGAYDVPGGSNVAGGR